MLDAVMGLAVAALIAALAILCWFRERRNHVLEDFLAETDLRPPTAFRETLEIEEHRPDVFLRKSLKNGGRSL